jgi:PAS domain S-box-containing protein
VLCIGNDITERKTAEEALATSEEKYRRLFENSVLGVFQSTPEGKIITVNPAYARMFGYSSPNELMTVVSDVASNIYADPARRPSIFRMIEEAHQPVSAENVYKRKDGSTFVGNLHAWTVRNGKGESILEGFIEDVTERKNLEDQLRQSQKLETVGTLAGGVAHDFNNILTVIMGLSNLLQLSIEKDDIHRRYLDQIVASSERAADLTQSLLAFSRKQRIILQPHKVNDIVASTAKLLKRLLPEDIRLTMNLADGDAVSLLDVSQIGQVLMNLATNARDVMPHGGSLTITTERAKLDKNFTNTHGFGKPGNYVKLSVSDTGIGIDESTMKRIFEPFFTTKEVGKGTGLGLASVYGAVKQHNGYITVSSTLSKGTTFDIYFPLIDTPRPQRASAAPEILGGTETILLVEDDPDVRYMMTTILESQGYATMEAIDGEDAIRIYHERGKKVDLIILDVVMPRKNGKEALDEITHINPAVKAIFMSGYTGDVIIDKGIQRECVDFLQKPLSATALLAKVREVLDR